MKAVICTAYGAPEVLRVGDVPTPEPRRGQVRIRIHATSVTASDILVRSLPARRISHRLARLVIGWNAPRRTLGLVAAGEVDAVGRGAVGFRVGDQVFGMSQWRAGAYAQFVCWPASGLLELKPANVTFEEAAAIPYGGLLAIFFLRKAGLRAGQRILIYGASGAIGTAAVQLATHAGAHVTAVCSGANVDLVRRLGAEDAVDYTREDFTRRAERYDLIFDAVGRRKSASALVNASLALAPNGTILSVDHAFPKPTRADMDELARLVESGAVKPVIDRTYALEEIVEAHRYVDLGHKKGNVIVTIA